jgi:hypothetical protein
MKVLKHGMDVAKRVQPTLENVELVDRLCQLWNQVAEAVSFAKSASQ